VPIGAADHDDFPAGFDDDLSNHAEDVSLQIYGYSPGCSEGGGRRCRSVCRAPPIVNVPLFVANPVRALSSSFFQVTVRGRDVSDRESSRQEGGKLSIFDRGGGLLLRAVGATVGQQP